MPFRFNFLFVCLAVYPTLFSSPLISCYLPTIVVNSCSSGGMYFHPNMGEWISAPCESISQWQALRCVLELLSTLGATDQQSVKSLYFCVAHGALCVVVYLPLIRRIRMHQCICFLNSLEV